MGIPLGSPRHRPMLGLTWKQTLETYEREGLVDLTTPCTCGSLRAIRFGPQHVGCRRCGSWVPQPQSHDDAESTSDDPGGEPGRAGNEQDMTLVDLQDAP